MTALSLSIFLFLLVILTTVLVQQWWVRQRLGPRLESPFADLPVRRLEVDGWSFRYHISGRGPYVVLVHGLGANLFCWRWLIPLLRARYTVVALDLPGFGQSSKPENAHYGLDDQVERLGLFFRQLKLHHFYIVGSSMGGAISLWYALQHPDQVLGVSVIAPATSPSLVPLQVRHLQWLARPISGLLSRTGIRWAHHRTVSRTDRVEDARIEESFRTYSGEPLAVRAFLRATEAIRDRRLPDALADIQCPVQVLWGSHDLLVPRKVIETLSRRLAKVETHVHEGGGHHLQEDDPDWVMGKIDAFFGATPDQDPH